MKPGNLSEVSTWCQYLCSGFPVLLIRGVYTWTFESYVNWSLNASQKWEAFFCYPNMRRVITVTKSERLQETTKLTEELPEVVEEEAMQQYEIEEALLYPLTGTVPRSWQEDSSLPEDGEEEQQNEQTTGGTSSEGKKRDWVMETLLETYPNLTEEEIKEAAYGLLG